MKYEWRSLGKSGQVLKSIPVQSSQPFKQTKLIGVLVQGQLNSTPDKKKIHGWIREY